jgi:hypothetical protein
MVRALAVAIIVAGCGGCSDDASTPDGRPDGAVDAQPDAFVPVCTGPQELTGELIDFDSSPANFLGVFDAVFTLRGEPACTEHTAPNGRFILHVPTTDQVVDVDAPDPYLDGALLVPRDTITTAGIVFSLRGVSLSRAMQLDPAQDAAHGLVAVNQSNIADVWTLTGAGASFDSEDGTIWAAGNDQPYILFTSVAPGTQTLSGSGIAIGGGDIPVVAGQITWVATSFTP